MVDASAHFAPARKPLEQDISFVQQSDLVVEQLKRGRVICRMPFAGNGNHIGTMYAGALFTLAEIPGGALFLTSFDVRRFHPIVKALNLKFLKPAKADVRVEARLDDASIARIEAEASEQGKAEFMLNLELRDETGTLVATSEAVYQLRRNS